MFYINKISNAEAIDFAAEELKKYLRMMRPDAGNVKISYNEKATDGFRLGLMSDFGLDTSDALDTELDDIIYVDTKANEGIIAGSNPRSVLFAVYEYLKKQGCGFYYPGFDGEFIPTSNTTDEKDLANVKHRFVPTTRYRGQSVFYYDTEQVDFLAKLGINTAMIEFFNPGVNEYTFDYDNPLGSGKELNKDFALQVKRKCEIEVAKRGLHFHDIGHGWITEALGFDNSLGRDDKPNRPNFKYPGYHTSLYSEEQRSYLAMTNGERKFIFGKPMFTQICMSNEVARRKIVDFIANYSKTHSNIDYLHVWLGDLPNNHCECEKCRTRIPSDWYMIFLNELDLELSRREDKMKVVFIAYTDTIWAPLYEKIKNNDRFLLLVAPIERSYSMTYPETLHEVKLNPFVLNKCKFPESLYEDFAYIKEWDRAFVGDKITFEYHFWRHMTYDMTGIEIARRVFEDAKAYAENGFSGFIQCGYPCLYFPTALAYYVYARTLYNDALSFDELVAEYLGGLFGEGFEKIYEIFKKINEILPFKYVSSSEALLRKNVYVDKERAEKIPEIKTVLDMEREFIEARNDTKSRAEMTALKVLDKHIEFVSIMSEVFLAKAKGENDIAAEKFEEMKAKMARHKPLLSKYLLYSLYYSALTYCVKIKPEDSTYVL